MFTDNRNIIQIKTDGQLLRLHRRGDVRHSVLARMQDPVPVSVRRGNCPWTARPQSGRSHPPFSAAICILTFTAAPSAGGGRS